MKRKEHPEETAQTSGGKKQRLNNNDEEQLQVEETHGDEEYDDEDEDEIVYGQMQALPVMDEKMVKNFDVESWHKTLPETPEEYLFRVRYIAKNLCEGVKVASNYKEKIQQHVPTEEEATEAPAASSSTSGEQAQTTTKPNTQVLEHETMKQQCLNEFITLRNKIQAAKAKHEKETAGKSKSRSDWKSVERQKPTTSLLLSLDFVGSKKLFRHLVETVIYEDDEEDEKQKKQVKPEDRKNRLMWLYSLMTLFDYPLNFETAGDMNSFFEWSLNKLQDNNCTEKEDLRNLGIIICLFFKQGDPSVI